MHKGFCNPDPVIGGTVLSQYSTCSAAQVDGSTGGWMRGVGGGHTCTCTCYRVCHQLDVSAGLCAMTRFTLRLPDEYKRETLLLVKLAGPVFISQLMSFLIGFVSLVFCGHLGKTELAGVALAIAVINVSGISIGSGLASACDTLISQTYGSGNLKLVGVILQRGILILLLACLPCWAVLLNTQPLLLAVGQSAHVARLAQLYVNIFMPALPAAFMYQLQGRYLQNQGIMWPQVISAAASNVFNAIINYVFLVVLDLGVAGSAAANAISQYSLMVFLFVYMNARGLHKATWGGWSLNSLREWGPFLRLALPSMMMTCLEWWLYEIAGFLAGLISEVELGAESILYQLAVMVFMFPVGFSVAASVRVGNALGAGNTELAKLCGKVSVACALVVSCFTGTFLAVCRNFIAYIFTTDKEIVARVATVLEMYSASHVADSFAAVTGGIVRGAGKQTVGALCSLLGYYVVGFPIGVSLMFPINLGIFGLWAGFLICVILQSLFYTIYLCKLNWKKATVEALVRAGVHVREQDKIFVIDSKTCEQQMSTTASNPSSPEEPEPDAAVPLSIRQLALRRGLAVLFMLALFGVGVLMSELLVSLQLN
ncbi:LOW QUALITY PROTEIN: multidrug and toxin extrusion protein 1-like [Hippocampus zosterae]|uniref:LOW QUALITY PROTEIN: multidrug and toxin extrusion protein 1-like n=1 Tax=Hippocampus zosterae TaxID=109293 RepID=UPI00223C929B|nr:LOW QUALITY PROTEIN: multidrug and toxin extrusion protein 1-like [Hippocampus zosterae]